MAILEPRSGNGRGLFCDRWNATAINFANVEIFAAGYMPAQSSAAADARANQYWGAAV